MARVVSRDLQITVSNDLAPAARSHLIADFARQGLREAQEQNRVALGQVPKHSTFVDGRQGAALEQVNPDRGTIAFVFEIANPAIDWIWEQILLHSPVLTGRYRRSHKLFADGVEMDAPDPTRIAAEWVILSEVPYARKIERGLSDQASEGVYEVVAALASQRFGNIADIRFTYQSVLAGGIQRYSAVALGGRTKGKTASAALRDANARHNATRTPAIVIRMR